MTSKKRKTPIVGFVSLGCPKNVVDSERMLAEIAQAGLLITGETDNADVLVINTCGFIAPAIEESIEAVRNAAELKKNGRIKRIVVAGCLSERMGDKLFAEVSGIDAVVGLGQRDDIVKVIRRVLSSDRSTTYLGDSAGDIHDDRGRLLITPGHWAYLRISEGCDRRCSFCTIPSIRGPLRSKSQSLVLEEARELVSSGVVELNVIAQDTTSYGRDLKIRNGLVGLLGELETISSLAWIRLMYMYPEGISDKLIEAVARSDKIVHYLDIPIQHASDRILAAMRRPGTNQTICRLVEKLRKAMPDIILRTTLIVGFPGETDREYERLREFVEWARFDALGCFKFYPEQGTEAAEMPDQVPDDVKHERLDEIMLTQQQIAFDKNSARLGGKVTCLVDSVDGEGLGTGRFYGQAPEIDGICSISGCSAEPGCFIEAKVTGTDGYDLAVRQVRG